MKKALVILTTLMLFACASDDRPNFKSNLRIGRDLFYPETAQIWQLILTPETITRTFSFTRGDKHFYVSIRRPSTTTSESGTYHVTYSQDAGYYANGIYMANKTYALEGGSVHVEAMENNRYRLTFVNCQLAALASADVIKMSGTFFGTFTMAN